MAQLISTVVLGPVRRFDISYLSVSEKYLVMKDNVKGKAYRIRCDSAEELASFCAQSDAEWMTWLTNQGVFL